MRAMAFSLERALPTMLACGAWRHAHNMREAVEVEGAGADQQPQPLRATASAHKHRRPAAQPRTHPPTHQCAPEVVNGHEEHAEARQRHAAAAPQVALLGLKVLQENWVWGFMSQ